MNKLCFMTTHHSYPPVPRLSLPQELTNIEIIKVTSHEILPASSFNPQHLEPLKTVCSFNKLVETDTAMMKPLLMNVHGKVLSFRQEKVMEFLRSRSNEFKERGFDISLLSELMELDEAINSSSKLLLHASSTLYLNQELRKPVNFSLQSDILSIPPEFEFSRQLSPLIPHFPRFESEVVVTPVTVIAPLISPKKTSVKPLPKPRKTKGKAKEMDLYKRNNLHVYESLLSLMIGNDRQHNHTTVLSLQRSSGELSELLTQLSISVAGTGIAVLFSVVSSLASSRVPFCANKFFDTGLGFSLVILSWSVNRLREVIVHVNRKQANKQCSISSLKNEEIINSVERGVKEVYFRAATVVAVFALRFAC